MFKYKAWVKAKKESEGKDITNQYIDIPVNIRHRIDGLNGYEYAGFYVTEVTLKCDVTEDTKLWDLARNIQVQSKFYTFMYYHQQNNTFDWKLYLCQDQLNGMIKQDQHLLFAEVKEKWETGEDTKDLAMAAGQKGRVSDVKCYH